MNLGPRVGGRSDSFNPALASPHQLLCPLHSFLGGGRGESSNCVLRSCWSSFGSLPTGERKAQRGEGPHLQTHSFSNHRRAPTEARGLAGAPRVLPLALMLIYKGENENPARPGCDYQLPRCCCCVALGNFPPLHVPVCER